MVTFLEKGYAFYIMMLFVTVGLLGKLVVRRIYNNLIRQADEMIDASSDWMKQLRLRYESFFKKNGQVGNTKALIEKYMYRYRFMGFRLYRLERMLLHSAIACTMIALVAAFATYQLQLGTELISKYLFAGLLAAGGCFFLDNLLETDMKKEILEVHIQEYFDNTLVYRLQSEQSIRGEDTRNGMRDDIFMRKEEPEKETGLAKYDTSAKLLRDRKSRSKRLERNSVVELAESAELPEESIFAKNDAASQTAATADQGGETKTSIDQQQFMELVQRFMEQMKQQ